MRQRAAVTVGSWVGGLVLEELDETVEEESYESAQQWSQPVDPVVAIECVHDDIGPKSACWIERTTREPGTCKHQQLHDQGVVNGELYQPSGQ